MYSTKEWEDRCGFHPADKPTTQTDHQNVRRAIYKAGLEIFEVVPFPSPEATKIANKLLEAMFWANHTVAVSQSPLDENSLRDIPMDEHLEAQYEDQQSG